RREGRVCRFCLQLYRAATTADSSASVPVRAGDAACAVAGRRFLVSVEQRSWADNEPRGSLSLGGRGRPVDDSDESREPCCCLVDGMGPRVGGEELARSLGRSRPDARGAVECRGRGAGDEWRRYTDDLVLGHEKGREWLMISLGIDYSQMDDASACIVRDGELLYADGAYRLGRTKQDVAFAAMDVAACSNH